MSHDEKPRGTPHVGKFLYSFLLVSILKTLTRRLTIIEWISLRYPSVRSTASRMTSLLLLLGGYWSEPYVHD